MNVKQIYELMNNVTSEILGKTDLVAEDLSNIVDVGTEILSNTDTENYVKTLVDRIGKVIFVNRPYSGNVPSVLMDSWEFGSVLQKITADLPNATENQSWELEDGKSYDPNVFYKPSVSAKFFNSKVTFEIPCSFTELQVKSSFASASELNGFVSMIYNAVDKAMTIKIDSLVMRTINNMTAQTMYKALGTGTEFTGKTDVKAVNLLKEYNDKFGTTLTATTCVNNPEFIRYASYVMGLYKDRLGKISTLFNVGGKDRFTPADSLHVVLLSEFAKSADVYLQSDVRHNELTSLPNYETVPYWQASGTNYEFAKTSEINVVIKDIEGSSTEGITVTATGILGVMFDNDALGVCNTDKRVTTAYNAKAEFYNNWYKFDASYFNDLNENFVVFFVA